MAALASACAPALAGRPAWLVSRQSQDIRAEHHFTGAGEGASAAEADARAQADLLARLQAEGRARLARLLGPGAPAELRLARLDPAAELLSAPAAARVVARWQSTDGARFASLAALDRAELAAALAEQMAGLSAQVEEALRTSRELGPATPYAGVLHALGAYLLLGQLQDARACLVAVQPDALRTQAQGPDEAALGGRLDEALAALELFAPAQAAWRAGEEGRTALLVAGARASGTGEPAAGVPLRFSNPEAGFAREARTDEAGLVSLELDLAAAAAPGARLRLALGLDGQAALAEAGLDPADPRWTPLPARLGAARAHQVLARPAAGGAQVALLVAELRSGKFQPDSRAAQTLAQALAAQGFRPRPTAELSFQLEGEPTPERVAAALAGQAELAIYGVVQTQLDPRQVGGLVFAMATGELVAVRLPTGEVLGRHQGSARGAGLDAGQAEGRSLQAFAQKALELLLPGLSGAAPPPGSAP
ncbi:MAG TPA: hypothetical protein PK668_06450 [Myxococcota bacterium]|nr:hypothetical protein [Myxococcota bacterium]HRY92517.1 hypothetical protein [Myxococcota bacterium]